MEDSDNSDLIKHLEMDGQVPEYLKTSLVSEIELIKDTLQVVSLFGGVFFHSVVRAMASVSDPNENND